MSSTFIKCGTKRKCVLSILMTSHMQVTKDKAAASVVQKTVEEETAKVCN